ncbi:MAG: hypothetical protein Q9175_003160 [Cornicularia normoerica]
MAATTQLLSDYLKRDNPAIKNHKPKNKKNTTYKSEDAPYKYPKIIKEWQDFTYDTLNSMYGGALQHVLDLEYTLHDFSDLPEYPFCEIHNENSLESFIVKWNHSVICDALAAAQGQLEQTRDDDVYMVRGGQASNPNFIKHRRRFEPDWAGVQRRNDQDSMKPKNILPGDTKISAKWSSGNVRLGRQIFTYCLRGNTRQYSQTSATTHQSIQEDDGSPAARARKDGGILEIRSIPWENSLGMENHDGEILTVNLALWWLHSLAIQGCGIEDEYLPLRCELRLTKPSTRLSSVGFSDVTSQAAGPSTSGKEFSFQSTGSRTPRQNAMSNWDGGSHTDDNSVFSHEIDTSPVSFVDQETPRRYPKSQPDSRKRRRDVDSDDTPRQRSRKN